MTDNILMSLWGKVGKPTEPLVFDFDAFGITPSLLQGMASGSAAFDTDVLTDEVFWSKISADNRYICKFSVPGTGAYYLSSTYTMVDDSGASRMIACQVPMYDGDTLISVGLMIVRSSESSARVTMIMKPLA